MSSTRTTADGTSPRADSPAAERGDQPVTSVMGAHTTRLAPFTSLRQAAAALRRDDVSVAAIGEGKAVDGVISERDLVAAIESGVDLDQSKVEDLASHSLKWAASSSTVDDVAREMLETHVRHVLVCDHDGDLVGIVSMRDLLSAYVD